MRQNEYLWSKGLRLSSLPHNKFLNMSKLKAFEDKNMNVTHDRKHFFDRVENIKEKQDENAV